MMQAIAGHIYEGPINFQESCGLLGDNYGTILFQQVNACPIVNHKPRGVKPKRMIAVKNSREKCLTFAAQRLSGFRRLHGIDNLRKPRRREQHCNFRTKSVSHEHSRSIIEYLSSMRKTRIPAPEASNRLASAQRCHRTILPAHVPALPFTRLAQGAMKAVDSYIACLQMMPLPSSDTLDTDDDFVDAWNSFSDCMNLLRCKMKIGNSNYRPFQALAVSKNGATAMFRQPTVAILTFIVKYLLSPTTGYDSAPCERARYHMLQYLLCLSRQHYGQQHPFTHLLVWCSTGIELGVRLWQALVCTYIVDRTDRLLQDGLMQYASIDDHSELIYNCIDTMQRWHDWDGSKRQILKLQATAPHTSHVYSNDELNFKLASCLEANGQIDTAFHMYTTILRRSAHPRISSDLELHHRTIHQLGRLHQAKADFPRAAECYMQFLEERTRLYGFDLTAAAVFADLSLMLQAQRLWTMQCVLETRYDSQYKRFLVCGLQRTTGKTVSVNRRSPRPGDAYSSSQLPGVTKAERLITSKSMRKYSRIFRT